MSDVTIIIPAFNAASTLAEQLDAIAAQEECSAQEIIVADNGSHDGLGAVVATYKERGAPIRLVDASQTKGSAFARNIGAAAATTSLLAFCDADDVVDQGWLRAITAALELDDLVGGRLDGTRLNSETVAGWRSPRTTAALSTPEGFLPFAPSGNLGVRSEVWASLDGMRVDYPRSHDVEFSWRAQLAGHSLGYAEDAVVHYRYRDTASDTFGQGVKSGRAMAQLYRDFGDDGLRGRKASTSARDWAWLVARGSMLVRPATRGVWARRAGQAVGRAHGSAKYRVGYL